MLNYALKRILAIVPLLLIVSFLAFVFINLSPYDPAEVALRALNVPEISDELLEKTREELGLNEPFVIRYVHWLKDMLRLDLGASYVSKQPVSALIGPAFLNTLKLTVVTAIYIIILSLLLGIFCAINEGKLADRVTRGIMFFLTAMPSYWIATLAIWFFAVKLDLFPTSGMGSSAHYVLPVTMLSLNYIGFYFRLIRNSMIQNTNENYVVYAKACGLKDKVVNKHILKNSLQTTVAVFGMAIPGLVAGTVVIENVFAWPGIGRLCVTSILNRDLPVIQGYIIVVALAFVFFNLLADLLSSWLNPKIQKG
ncbi:nickel/cobalt ABC transporter permease [Clostridium formicaceticum]|uniref:Nickel ABC transporter permease subunit NikB n=1 Tax=Clostridium formicaceticum TaxID=1497 RepID=A0AAC9WHH6_9CLOT|nr:nickel/cobalt ABC transporter permease [Clostridium formicaceticum]AOY74588.1 nickel ABC transporter permease subunit NikB [Clostridium formicaceticum]ARE88951.1 Nickel transport system permease protein NikB [Clostridium formicaceticum]